jgi:uncharacterized membrane protein SirB2
MEHLAHRFAHWLASTGFSATVQTVSWVIPSLQTIHILAIAVVFSSAMMVNLRLLGLLDRAEPAAAVAARFLPLIWPGLLVLLVTGSILVVGEPKRSLETATFYVKMAFVIAAIGVTFVLQRNLSRDDRRRPVLLKSAAVISIALWSLVIFAGRWIAYSSQN